MKAKMIDSTNKLLFISFGGIEGKLTLDGNATWIKTIWEQFHTSAIVSYELLSDNIVILHTLNSEYTFELIGCEFDSSGLVNLDEELVEQHKKLKLKKSAKWFCQISGDFLDGCISIVTLPEPMEKYVAEEYILKHNIRDDNEGCLIMSLQNPLD